MIVSREILISIMRNTTSSHDDASLVILHFHRVISGGRERASAITPAYFFSNSLFSHFSPSTIDTRLNPTPLTMSLKGQHLEPLAPTSAEFLQYQAVFGTQRLVKLYKISYESTAYSSLDRFDDYPSIFYHGTGNCGCIIRRGLDTQLAKINANEWCGGSNCATQGILSHGHLMSKSRGGKLKADTKNTRFPFLLTALSLRYKQNNEQCLPGAVTMKISDHRPLFLSELVDSARVQSQVRPACFAVDVSGQGPHSSQSGR
jgi:hypothetical protein